MEQHAVLKQGAKEFSRWSDRVLTIDTEHGFAYLSEKNNAANATHHKLYVQCVQTWPNYKPRYVVEGQQSPESMLTIRIRGIAVDADATDKVRVSESREGSPSLRASRMRASPGLTGNSPARATMPSSLTMPPAASAQACTDNSDVRPDDMSVSEERGLGISESASDKTRESMDPCSPPSSPLTSPSSPLLRDCPFIKGGSEWWMIRVSSLTQLARVLLSFQHMNPDAFNAHQLLLPAKTALLARHTPTRARA